MARQFNHRSEVSGSIHFDSRTNTVMAEATQDNIKEKVQAVREVVPGKSNNEVVLVLQYYDYNVEKAIQAYLEDGAKEALLEWNFTGSKQPNKKRKNKKKGSGEKPGNKSGPGKGEPAINGKSGLPNGDVLHESQPEVESIAIVTNMAPAVTTAFSLEASSTSSAVKESSLSSTPIENVIPSHPQRQTQAKRRSYGDIHHHQSPRERTISEISTGSGMGDGYHKKPHQGLEKAFKDLQRQTTSLERLRLLLDHEIDRSLKSLKTVFEELRQGLNNREAQLLSEMEIVKNEASEMLEMRQSKASELKRQVDRSDKLKDNEITDLRSEIKHFVNERRHDEDLGRTTRFLYDSDHFLEELKKFGEVIHVKSQYTSHNHRASISSVASSSVSHEGNHDDDLPYSKEVHELQDRLKNTLKLQDSSNKDHTSAYMSSTPNGPSRDGFSRNRQNRQNPQQPSQSSSYRGDHQVTQSPDVSSHKALLLPSPSSSNRGRTSSTFSSNTGSPSRGRRGGGGGGSAQTSRGGGGRGRGRGGGGGYGRGAMNYGGEGSRPTSSSQGSSSHQ